MMVRKGLGRLLFHSGLSGRSKLEKGARGVDIFKWIVAIIFYLTTTVAVDVAM